MANTKSALKRAQLTVVRTKRNAAVKSKVKTAARKVQKAVAAGKAAEATKALPQAASVIDRAASKGVLHKRTAARKKARLARQINRISG